MKKQLTAFLFSLLFPAFACQAAPSIKQVIETGLGRARQQSLLMAEALKDKDGRLPRTIDKDGNLQTSDSRWWCSGFFPGVLWYLYNDSKDEQFKTFAELYTARVEREKYTTDNHDVGFMLFCSFGNGLRFAGTESYKEVLMTGAKSLCTRYNPDLGVIKSWQTSKKWQYPVIIDNMMNLELLMWAHKNSGEQRFADIALSHADKTMREHYRPDYSCYHVVSYDTVTLVPEKKQTAQGYADESAWARGQAWGLYGYTMMARTSQKADYLNQARKIADFLMSHPNMPEDKVPYWDFNAPDIPNTVRDASSAAIMASALIELGNIVGGEEGKRYLAYAEDQIRSLTTPEYLAEPGTNGNFVLKHSTGSLPGKSEVDVPLTYADYYYVEALTSLKQIYGL